MHVLISKKNQLKIVIFTAMKNRCILHGRVFIILGNFNLPGFEQGFSQGFDKTNVPAVLSPSNIRQKSISPLPIPGPQDGSSCKSLVH